MPILTFGASGPSCAYTPPAHPIGTPASRIAAPVAFDELPVASRPSSPSYGSACCRPSRAGAPPAEAKKGAVAHDKANSASLFGSACVRHGRGSPCRVQRACQAGAVWSFQAYPRHLSRSGIYRAAEFQCGRAVLLEAMSNATSGDRTGDASASARSTCRGIGREARPAAAPGPPPASRARECDGAARARRRRPRARGRRAARAAFAIAVIASVICG